MLNALIFFPPELSLELRGVRGGLPVVRHLLHDGHERVAADGRDGLRLPRHIQQHAEPLPHAAQGQQLECCCRSQQIKSSFGTPENSLCCSGHTNCAPSV